MRLKFFVLLGFFSVSVFAVEGDVPLTIYQVDHTRHLVAVKVDGIKDLKELFVEIEKGEQCSLPVKMQSEGVLFLATEECPFEKNLRAGQNLFVSLFANLSLKKEVPSDKDKILRPSGYEITWRALSYQRTKIDADVGGQLKGSYEVTQSDFKTLPLDFELDIKTENFGVLLEPVSDESTVGGTLSPYIKTSLFDVGLFASYFLDKKNEKLVIGSRTVTSDTKGGNLSIGGFLRKEVEMPNYKLDLRFSLGYMKNETKIDTEKVTVDYLAGGIDLSTYLKVREGLFIGPSLSVGLGDGTIDLESAGDTLSSDTSIFIFSFSPFVMNFEF